MVASSAVWMVAHWVDQKVVVMVALSADNWVVKWVASRAVVKVDLLVFE